VAEGPELPEHGREDVLTDIFAPMPVSDDATDQPERTRVVPFDETGERRLVASQYAIRELSVVSLVCAIGQSVSIMSARSL
jgi:hypothetical protein